MGPPNLHLSKGLSHSVLCSKSSEPLSPDALDDVALPDFHSYWHPHAGHLANGFRGLAQCECDIFSLHFEQPDETMQCVLHSN